MVDWLVGEFLGQGLPAVDFAYGDRRPPQQAVRGELTGGPASRSPRTRLPTWGKILDLDRWGARNEWGVVSRCPPMARQFMLTFPACLFGESLAGSGGRKLPDSGGSLGNDSIAEIARFIPLAEQ
jgi:hypothetical protein